MVKNYIRKTGKKKAKKTRLRRSRKTWKRRQRGAPKAFRKNFERVQPVHFCDIQLTRSAIPIWGSSGFRSTGTCMFDPEAAFIQTVVQQKQVSGVNVAYSNANSVNNAQQGKNVLIGYQIRGTIEEAAAVTTASDYNIREVVVMPRDAAAWISGVENTTSNAIPSFLQPFTPYGACRCLSDRTFTIGTNMSTSNSTLPSIPSFKNIKRFIKMHLLIQDQWDQTLTLATSNAVILPALSYNGKGNKIWCLGTQTATSATPFITLNIRLYWKNVGI
ncbi:capsid protein [Miresoil virus 415]|uniref:Capsid protein n=1 Tax=Miresoil virus 415 TaxID=2911459 RepID=A0A9E9C112_9VIRU|nr:capsid protein [Miresoil virus 415]